MRQTIVAKFGGAVVTDKSIEDSVREDVLEQIAFEVGEARRENDFNLVVALGSGSIGHPKVKRHNLKAGVRTAKQEAVIAEIDMKTSRMVGYFCDRLEMNGVRATKVRSVECAKNKDGKLSYFNMRSFRDVLGWGAVPVTYGSMVVDDSPSRYSVLSADDIVTFIASGLPAQRLLMGTDVRGIYARDPKRNPGEPLIRLVDELNYPEILEMTGGSTHADVTGGMHEKLRKIREAGVAETYIFDATKEGNVREALLGRNPGTFIEF